MRLSTFACVVLFSFTLLSADQNTKVTLQNGLNNYQGCIDTYILNKKATENFGNSGVLLLKNMISGKGCCGKKKDTLQANTILKFDLSTIPTEAVVDEAILSLYVGAKGCGNCNDTCGQCTGCQGSCHNNCDKNGPKKLYAMTKPWDEVTATWEKPWVNKGGDFNPVAISDAPGSVNKGWETFKITIAVQEMVKNQSTNNGLLLQFPTKGFGAKFYSSETKIDSLRPKLYISYTTVNGTTNLKQNMSKGITAGHSLLQAGMVHISMDKSVRISFSDLQGRVLSSFVTNPMQQHYAIPTTIKNGTYMISMVTASKVISEKIILVR